MSAGVCGLTYRVIYGGKQMYALLSMLALFSVLFFNCVLTVAWLMLSAQVK